MKNFMQEYERNLRHIKENQKEIYTSINRYTEQNTELEIKILTMIIFEEIERSFQYLYDRLETLENAVTVSHVGKLHPSIIDPSYLIEELNFIQNTIDVNVAFDPNIRNIHLWETAITVKAYSTNGTVNFILEIPLVAKQLYNLLYLYSIPTNHNIILIPKNPIMILGNNEFAYRPEPCNTITKDEVICRHLQWQDLRQSNDCIAQLLQHLEPHNCTYATATYEDNIIQQIKDNTWIVALKQEEVIKTTCGNDIQYQRNKGVFLITIDNNCNVQVKERILTTHQKYINVRETIPLPRAHQAPQTMPTKIKLQNIELDNLKQLYSKCVPRNPRVP
ncbi:hypothetical protein O3G_MSEX004679 [Manduca sexta]|uniref:Envelope protein n=1 Tax=Manduca sexta TaxID=7130 RepID=A0A921YX24_MANSE|nr:hypothetical protein O3G_MSEX004679 [Manduca sexta]